MKKKKKKKKYNEIFIRVIFPVTPYETYVRNRQTALRISH